MPYRDGEALREAYRQRDRFAFVASNIVETSTVIGLLKGYARANSDVLVQISAGAVKFAGGGRKRSGLRSLSAMSKERAVPDSGVQQSRPFHRTRDGSDREVPALARGSGILAEAELGRIKGVKDAVSSDEAPYADPAEAVESVQRSRVDLLAIPVGTQHGVSKGRELELSVDPESASGIDSTQRDAIRRWSFMAPRGFCPNSFAR